MFEGNSQGNKFFLKGKDVVKKKLHYVIIHELDNDDATNITAGKIREIANNKIKNIILEEDVALSSADREEILQEIIDEVTGYGPIEELIQDPEVTEIMVNNAKSIYIEKHGKIFLTDKKFVDEKHLLKIIDKIVSGVGRRIDESSPYVDARLPDGSRVNAIIKPLAVNGPVLTIRKFSPDAYSAEDLVVFGTISEDALELVKACVKGRLNIIISGGSGTGKTTTLNMLSDFIPEEERIITVEDAVELKLQQKHVLQLESRPPNIEGEGEVTIRDLVRNTLRMRPDRIIVGEARGAEALDMLQAMNTGHDGSMTTIHSNTPRDALARIETMALMSGMDLTLDAIRNQVASAIDLIIHQSRFKDGTRRITQIVEVQWMEGETIILSDLFKFDYSMGIDNEGRFQGILKSTGIRPMFLEKLSDYGITVSPDIFKPSIFGQRKK